MIRVLAWLNSQQIYNHVLDEQQAIETANELERDGCVVRLVEGPKTLGLGLAEMLRTTWPYYCANVLVDHLVPEHLHQSIYLAVTTICRYAHTVEVQWCLESVEVVKGNVYLIARNSDEAIFGMLRMFHALINKQDLQ